MVKKNNKYKPRPEVAGQPQPPQSASSQSVAVPVVQHPNPSPIPGPSNVQQQSSTSGQSQPQYPNQQQFHGERQAYQSRPQLLGNRPPQQQFRNTNQQNQPSYQHGGYNRTQQGSGNFRGRTVSKLPAKVPEKSIVAVPGAVDWQPGTQGQHILVEVNFLKMMLNKLVNVAQHYDVSFDPERMPRRFLPKIVDEFQAKHFPNCHFAFDGRCNVYTPTFLPMEGKEFTREVKFLCKDTDCEKSVTVTMKWAAEIDLRPLKNLPSLTETPQTAVMAMDVVLRSAHKREGVIPWKKAFFDPARTRYSIGPNHELWQGLSQSFVLGWQPYLNVDIANKVFPKPMHVLDVVENIARNFNNLSHSDLRNIGAQLNGLRIIYSPPDAPTNLRMFMSQGLCRSANDEFFTDDRKRKISVAQYFANKNCRLQYPHLPCIKTGGGKSILPMEFCRVAPGQASNKQAPDACKSEMIKITALPTSERRQKILQLIEAAEYRNPVIAQFGIDVGVQFEKVEARILPAPNLRYAGDKSVTPVSGVWNLNNNEQFLQPMPINRWSIICMDSTVNRSVIKTFINKFVAETGKRGMKVARIDEGDINYDLADYRRQSINDIQRVMQTMQNDQLIICIIPDNDAVYAKVKQCSEHLVGVLTSCLLSKTITRTNKHTGDMDKSFVENILLKINAKVNGLNHKIQKPITSLLKRPFMVIGADVTHPSPDQTKIPSLVGVVASTDPNAFKYNCSYRIQGPRQEMIDGFDDIVKEHLNRFKVKNKRLPEIILYYRDGVGDGQFDELKRVEYESLKKACSEIEQGYNPLITIIVVQKRHRIRFFPLSQEHSDGQNENVMPGTVVDKEIVNMKKKQFYLVSHASIKGVAKPAKYQIIHDDSNFTADQIQELTYSMCHLFTRCNRTVSYVAPTYYAHLVAARARSYIKDCELDMDNLDEEYRTRQIQPALIESNPMFFA